jgi:hypothetical protein
VIVYGDRRRTVHVRAALARLVAAGPGIDRLIDASEVACGILDRARERRGTDDDGPLEDACHAMVLAAARDDDFAGALERLGRLDLPGQVEVNAAIEGFAHYGVDPQQYARAARYARVASPAPDRVIGIRSIGLPLAAMVAASLGPAAVVTSVRPVGRPRAIAIGPGLRRRLLGSRGGFAVVDEGPGLTGASFAAVVEWLTGQGVPSDRIALFPAHGAEPGVNADERARAIWRAARRYLAEPDLGFLTDGADQVDDLAGGRWRYRLGLDPGAWPPADRTHERRKLIVDRSGTRWLCKFAGLGHPGRVKEERARALAGGGFHPRVRALCRGFLVTEWHDGARPLFADAPVPRPELVFRLADYLAARTELPATGPGAPPCELLDMAVANAIAALGGEAGRAIEQRWRREVAAIGRAIRPVAIDGRMHRWEWIALPDGRLFKTDAVDHALGHDLVGEQDLAWDLAGAEIEHELTRDEAELLRSRLGRPAAPPGLEDFHRTCYAAFQLGLFAVAESHSRDAGHEDEAMRLAAEGARYRDHLSRLALAS